MVIAVTISRPLALLDLVKDGTELLGTPDDGTELLGILLRKLDGETELIGMLENCFLKMLGLDEGTDLLGLFAEGTDMLGDDAVKFIFIIHDNYFLRV